MDLNGATVLVTGGSRGIGLALARRLVDEPLALLLVGVRSLARQDDVDLPRGRAAQVRYVAMDMSSRESIEHSCAALGDTLSEIDVLINNAGLMTGGLLEEQDIEQVYAMFQVNLVAVAHLTARVLPGMIARRRGKIVNNVSISGYAHFPAASTYAAGKAGVVALTEALRRELKGTGVSTLCLVTPGVNTDMLDATERVYGRHIDTSGWDKQEPDEWAGRVLAAIGDDRRRLDPGGQAGWAVRASRGPTWLLDRVSQRIFSRAPRA